MQKIDLAAKPEKGNDETAGSSALAASSAEPMSVTPLACRLPAVADGACPALLVVFFTVAADALVIVFHAILSR